MKVTVIFGIIIAAFFADVTCQKLILPISAYSPPTHGGPTIIKPTYRPPFRRGPILRTARDIQDEPLWLWKDENIDRAPATGDFPNLPSNIDDVRLDPNRRHARSVDSPSAKRYGGGRSTATRESRNPGATHPGYNRRNARDLWNPQPRFPFEPRLPQPHDPFRPPLGRPRTYPIYARVTRDVQFPGIKKPTHRDIIIPNWNPHVRTQPWQRIGGSRRNTRSVEEFEAEE